MVTSVAAGAPEDALVWPVAPMAVVPFLPLESTPRKLITVNEETTLCDRVAVTATLVSAAFAKARQISDVPRCTLVAATRTQVRPPPDTDCTVVFAPDA